MPPGARRAARLVASTPTSERSSTSASLLASLMAAERLRLLGLAVDEVQGDAGLHVDQRHVVRDDVVQLAGDPQPLLVGLTPTFLVLACRAAASAPGGSGHLSDREDHQPPREDAGASPRPGLVAHRRSTDTSCPEHRPQTRHAATRCPSTTARPGDRG